MAILFQTFDDTAHLGADMVEMVSLRREIYRNRGRLAEFLFIRTPVYFVAAASFFWSETSHSFFSHSFFQSIFPSEARLPRSLNQQTQKPQTFQSK